MKRLSRGVLVAWGLAGLPLLALAQPIPRPPAPGVRAAPAPAAPQVALHVGAQQRLDVPGLQRVTVGDPAVADVRTAAAHLTVRGMAPGRTTVTVWAGEVRTSYDVVVH